MDYLNTDVLNDVLDGPIAGNISSMAESAFHFDFAHGPQVQAGQTHQHHSRQRTRQQVETAGEEHLAAEK